jgi:predicted nucleic-acid-binding Zn-ribbon protein
MVEVRKAKGDTLEFHKVTIIHAKIMLVKEQYMVLMCVNCNFLQFYKNLSKTLKDVVWKSEDLQMQPAA